MVRPTTRVGKSCVEVAGGHFWQDYERNPAIVATRNEIPAIYLSETLFIN